MLEEKSRLQRVSLGLLALAAVAGLLALGPGLICNFGNIDAAMCAEDHLLRQYGVPLVVALFALFGGVAARQVSVAQERRKAFLKRAADRSSTFTPIHGDRFIRDGVDSSSELRAAIELDEELDLGVISTSPERLEEDEEDSLMSFVEKEQNLIAARKEAEEAAEEEEGATVDGFYCPPGMGSSPILYVDPSHEGFSVDDEARVNNPAQPYTDVTAAMKHATRIVQESGQRVQVRLLPGVYQTALAITDRIVLLNHRMPAEGTIRQRKRWLEEQETIDHPERVTLLPPQDAQLGVRFAPGRLQGIFGVHLVGRDGVKQAGIKASGNTALAILHSSIEGFSRGALHMTECGEELAGRQVHIMGCRFKGNTSLRPGAAINVQRSIVRIEDCIFDSNTATIGGAIFARDLKGPLLITHSELLRNRALTKKGLPDPLTGLKLNEWQNQEGLGGAIALDRSRLKVSDSRFDGNDATLGGGAIAALGGQVVLQGDGKESCEFLQNRATVGGGVLAVGWTGARSLVKCRDVVFRGNIAKIFGGAVAALGLSVAQLEGGKIMTNGCGGKDGMGGGIGAFRGPRVLLDGVDISENRARVHGGGIAAINATIKLIGSVPVARNEAESGKGGGVFAMTRHDAEMDQLVTQPGIELPFTLVIEEAAIEYNVSRGPGAGLYAGNNLPHSTFPLQIDLRKPEAIWNNRSQTDEKDGADLFVSWAHQPRATSRDKLPVDLLLQ
ncbi:MAG: hypothetical protein ACNA8W_11310 [Bradymonadaceae bacterium]